MSSRYRKALGKNLDGKMKGFGRALRQMIELPDHPVQLFKKKFFYITDKRTRLASL
jgi:hypothetical protein